MDESLPLTATPLDDESAAQAFLNMESHAEQPGEAIAEPLEFPAVPFIPVEFVDMTDVIDEFSLPDADRDDNEGVTFVAIDVEVEFFDDDAALGARADSSRETPVAEFDAWDRGGTAESSQPDEWDL
jgi:hypothetical protein